jgi:hypothetical protein
MEGLPLRGAIRSLSFFDEDDEPRRSPRPRRARPAGGLAAADSQTLLVRRLVAAGIGVLVLIVIVVLVHSCSQSRAKTGLKTYNSDVSTIARESSDLGNQFFQLLGTKSSSPQDLTSQISSFQVQAGQEYDQAKALSTPGEMVGAQQNLLIALEMRRNGLKYIAARISDALGDAGDVADRAINEIAGQMQVFLASDVIYETRVMPFIQQGLNSKEIGGQHIAGSRFLPSQSWLNPTVVADQLNQQLTNGGASTGEPTGPGLHGTGLTSTAFGDTTLQPGTSNRLTFKPGTEFVVKFTNQGENDEFQVKVTVRIKAGAQQTTLTTTVDKIAQGATAEARLPLNRTPPLDAAATVSVQVAAVPGEKKTDNNKADYPALFTRG